MGTSTMASRPGARTLTARPARSRSVHARAQDRLLGYALVTPIVVIMAVVIAFPLVNAVLTSLRDERVIGSPSDWVGFETYTQVVADPTFWGALGRSGIWLVVNMIVQTVLAFATALLLQRRGVWSRTARTWVMLPWVIPTVAVAVIWQWMLNSNYGIVYRMFAAVGIDLGSPFSDTGVALLAVILVNSWHWFPLAAVVIYGALATVPGEVLEAAKMDGANAWQTFWAVTFPLLQPVLFALGLVGSLWSFNVLDTILLITGGGPAGATTTAPVHIYETAFGAFRSSEAAAASVLAVIVLAVAAVLFVKFLRPEED
ncbi:carbohydrate ABC transporter permease [Georgenia sp. AZ-5]|uniref:carbohydrate ABC transporter permease n=1 Tax=Georgenia sp. AZ-5 TaxID=3367526 RepID=UPI00375518EC